MTATQKTIKAAADRNAEIAARFAAMTDAELAGLLMAAQAESVELTRTWGRDGSDAWCSTVANRLNEKIAIARAELANRRQFVAA
jgi:hypothetical protein